jgi:hypothetical protein
VLPVMSEIRTQAKGIAELFLDQIGAKTARSGKIGGEMAGLAGAA